MDDFPLLFAKGSDTSFDAALSVEDVTGRLRVMVAKFISEQKDRGATCDEVEVALDLRHQTASARVNELRNKGVIADSEKRRLTRSGRNAAVWVVKSRAQS